MLTPLGSSYASLQWQPGSARLQAPGQERHADALETLVRELTGTDVPVAALFSWLADEAVAVPGWEVDMSQRASGRIRATRLYPAPRTELRLVLDQ